MKVRLHTDGASRGNPGPAGIGVVLVRAEDGQVLEELAEFIGEATNNVAEYRALIAGLRRALALGAEAAEVVSDSELMVRHLLGQYHVRSAGLAPLAKEARRLLLQFPRGFRVEHVPRERNRRADELAHAAIDAAATPGARRDDPLPAPPAGRADERRSGLPPGAAGARAAAPAPVGAGSPGRTPGGGERTGGQGPLSPAGAGEAVQSLESLARAVGPGESRELAPGVRLVRLPPGASWRPPSAWILVVEGGATASGQAVPAGACCRPGPAAEWRAGPEGTVVLTVALPAPSGTA